MNYFLEEEKASGRIGELAEEYIYQYIEEQEPSPVSSLDTDG